MVLFPFPALIFRADPAARLDAFLKAHPAFVATVDLTANGKSIATQTLRIARPRRLRLDAKGPGLDFSVSSVEGSFIELDRLGKVYDKRPTTGGFSLYDSRLSSAPSLIPSFLLGGASAVFSQGKPEATAVAGGDELKGTAMTQAGPIELKLLIDPQGKPLRFERKAGKNVLVWQLKSFADVKPDVAAFQIEPPLGYVPFAVPDLPFPLQIGQPAPLAGWHQGAKTVNMAEPQPGKPRLLAVLGVDSPPSRAARPALTKLGKSMPVFVIAPGEITDPSGTLLKKLSPPGTPMFYLVGGDGKVKGLWFGFDPAKAAAWEAEILEAAK